MRDTDDLSAIAESLGAKISKEQLAQMSKSTLTFSRVDDGYSMQIDVGTMSHDTKFKLGEEFEHNTLDGRQVKMLINVEGKKLTIDQMGDKDMLIENVVDGNNLTMTMKVGDVSCVRHYIKA
ncbi:Fatty acid-binding protein, heart [Sparganum proliferum]